MNVWFSDWKNYMNDLVISMMYVHVYTCMLSYESRKNHRRDWYLTKLVPYNVTHIWSDNTVLQVVDLLNDLYTTFDTVIEKFDVYKVRLTSCNY